MYHTKKIIIIFVSFLNIMAYTMQKPVDKVMNSQEMVYRECLRDGVASENGRCLTTVSCGHTFHTDCIQNYAREVKRNDNTNYYLLGVENWRVPCPVCQKELKFKEIYTVTRYFKKN